MLATSPAISGGPDGYRLTTGLWLRGPVEEVFELFSSPVDLQRITPRWLGLKVLTEEPIDMAAGFVIVYRFAVSGVPGRWKSLISEWEPPYRFVDEQVPGKGPFRTWRHEHTFRSERGGTWAQDDIAYTVHGGRLIHETVVRRNLTRLFNHRHEAMRKIFD